MRAQIVLFEGFDPLYTVPYEVLWAGDLASGSRERRELVPAEDPGACYRLRRPEAKEGLKGPRGREL